MPTITLKAHFDGERIQLDEPFDLPRDSKLMVTVLTPNLAGHPDLEIELWRHAAASGLARAYGNDEPEYLASDVISRT